MGRFPQGRHSSAQFDDELNSIHSHLLEMGRLAMQQVQRATTALTTGDLTLASRVLFDEAGLFDYSRVKSPGMTPGPASMPQTSGPCG